MKTYCINLDSKPENFERILQDFGSQLDIERFSAIDGKKHNIKGHQALYGTNKLLFEKIAASADMPCVAIIEDDIVKTPAFDTYYEKIMSFVMTTKEPWDFISLEFILDHDNPTIEVYNELFYKVGKSRNTGFMLYNPQFIKKNLEQLTHWWVLDLTMTHDARFIKLIPKELLLTQLPTAKSSVSEKTCNYERNYKRTLEYIHNYFNNKN
jgi:GR25 family glycosyltransferase involved in LPS biosynthesis